MFTNDTLLGKTILITGGGSGLGFHMAKRCAELGAGVAICGRTEAKLTQAVQALQAAQAGNEAKGPPPRHYVCDVRDYEAVGQMQARIRRDFGSLRAVVNNAAGNFLAASEDLTPGGFNAVVDIVLKGSFNCAQQAGQHWLEQGESGTILNIVTTYTETGCAFVLPSACAKAGVQAMTTSLAYEWGPYGIRSNAIAPGPFPTEGAWSRLMPNQDFQQQMADRHPMGRTGSPEELAELAVFLLSDQASYINGECVNIDGGERLQGAQFNAIAQLMPREELKEAFRQMKAQRSS